ncbi:MAG: glycosyltransferase [Blastochloris sp.]|nr:glycosyltransferase [Blastochloris sp.]
MVRLLREQGGRATLLCESWNRAAEPFDEIVTLSGPGPGYAKPRIFAQKANDYLQKNSFDLSFSMERGIRADIYRAGDGVHRIWLERRREVRPVLGWLQNRINFKNRVLLALERETFDSERTGCVIANSEMVRREIERCFDYPQERVVTIPNGVDADYFGSGDRERGRQALGLGPEEFSVLLVGSGAERKGHAARGLWWRGSETGRAW